MGIEAATYVADLVAANPGAADLRSQGDDHLRLIKSVLQASFPTSSKAFYNPTTQAKSANFTVVATDMNKTFLVDTTGGAVNMTLPSLGAGDAGWECFHIKTTQGINPVFVVPASGTVTSGATAGLAQARRSIPGSKIRSLWTGTAWYISRAEGLGGPVGALVDFVGATLPYGFEWPSGQTLSSASTNYPEYFALTATGVTFDVRGRITLPLDNLGGSAASRVAAATAVGLTGGAETKTLVTANLPAYTPSGTVGGTVTISGGTQAYASASGSVQGGGSVGGPSGDLALHVIGAGFSGTFTGNSQGGTSTAFSILPPYAVVSKLLVVE